MDDSILISIKKLLGVSKDYTIFDSDIIMHINSVFMILSQLGIGSSSGFKIEDDSTTWSEYIDEDSDLEAVKTYIYLKVKLLFDPPLSSSVIEVTKQSIAELEWRLNVQTSSK